jgi:hypothetical protein
MGISAARYGRPPALRSGAAGGLDPGQSSGHLTASITPVGTGGGATLFQKPVQEIGRRRRGPRIFVAIAAPIIIGASAPVSGLVPQETTVGLIGSRRKPKTATFGAVRC